MVSEGKTLRKVCSASAPQEAAIKACEIKMDAECTTIPAEKRRDCFQDEGEKDLAFLRSCASGTKQVVTGFVDGVKEFGSNAKSAAVDSSAYMKKVRSDATKNCKDDFEYRRAKRNYELMAQNRGPDEAYGESMKMNGAWNSCLQREIAKGKTLGISFDLPNMDELKNTINCFNNDARVELGCNVVVPMLLGGEAAVAVRTQLLRAGTASAFRMSRKVAKSMEDFKTRFKERRTLAGEKSIEHQADVISPLKNPTLLEKIKAMGMDIDGYIRGVLASDTGKIAEAQRLLSDKDALGKSDQLLNVVKGVDSSKAGKAFTEFMSESGFRSQSLLNPALSNDEIRSAFQNRTVRGYMHELPGIQQAIEDLNAGRISVAEFKSELGANLFHNGPQKGFWNTYTTTFVPGALKGNPDGHGLFKNSALDSGKVTPDGVTVPVYPRSVSKEGIFHTNFDRLSQGTGGGSIKIGYELMGDEFSAQMLANKSVKIGSIPATPGSFVDPNGLNTFRDLFIGNKAKNVLSTPTNTMEQLEDLTQHIQTAKFLKPNEADVLAEISRASKDRVLAFKDFVEKNMRVVTDEAGNVEKMILSDANGKIFATFTKDSEAKDVLAGLEKFKRMEEKLNRDPFTDLMRPRFLSASEKAAYRLGGASCSYFYCNQEIDEPKPKMPINPFEAGVM